VTRTILALSHRAIGPVGDQLPSDNDSTRGHHNVSPIVHKNNSKAGFWWLTPVIPATQEAEIRRNAVQSQPSK
jgi:hypothetical protein